MKKKLSVILLCLLILSLFAGCTKKEDPKDILPEVTGIAIEHEKEFGGVYIKLTIDEFNAKGFVYGDSVDVVFSNGYELKDIPYFNGYYVDAGQPLLIAYPGYDYIKAAINYGEDLWEKAGLLNTPTISLWQQSGLDENATASVRVSERGKYLDVQQARDIHYSDERVKFDSDEIFANFRSFCMGRIRENTLYRSASPCDNQHMRATYVSALLKEAGVNVILNLSDNEEKISRYMAQEDFNCPGFLELYEKGNVYPIALNMNYLSEEFAQKIAQGFVQISEKEGPYLIHCTEGKDRTGFVCMLIEALCGGSYQEIADDYMLTYDNYYKINPEKDPDKYNTILEKNLNAMLRFVCNDAEADLKTADLEAAARTYLLNAGMSQEQIEAFLARICK